MLTAAVCAALVAAVAPGAAASPADQLTRLSGLHERAHRAQLKRTLGVDPARIPWCGAAVAWAVRKAGRKPPAGYMRAIAWRGYGKAVSMSHARRGDVLVLRNKRGHHVTILTRRAKGKVCAIGGNQGNQVKESCYSARAVVAVRR